MTENLPDPLTPADCDLRDVPFPWKELADAFAAEMGIPVEQAEAQFKDLLRRMGERVEGEEH